MSKKKPLWKKLTTRSRSKARTATPVYHLRRGIETKIKSVPRAIVEWGIIYQSIFRTSVNALQNGSSRSSLVKEYQKRFNIQWAWADSVLTDAQGTIDQLKESKKNQAEQLKIDLKSGDLLCEAIIKEVELVLSKPTILNTHSLNKKLMGLKSKISRLLRKKKN